ncbi:MAG: alanine racemase [Patescibacteria group bacterium]
MTPHPAKPAVRVRVRPSRLVANLRAMASLAPAWSVIPVLKSNAYGHGLVPVAKALEREEGVPFFGLDSYFEAEMLRAAGVMRDLLILGHTPFRTIVENQLPGLVFTVASLRQLQELRKMRVRARLHVKFDTGMHRQGIMLDELDAALAFMRGTDALSIEGVLSHLADAETPDSPLTKTQIERWNLLVARCRGGCPGVTWYHLANSAGFAHAGAIDANAGRTGIALYGVNPGNLATPLSPALSLESVITELRTIESGERVGYNGIFTATRETRVATVPIGYFEGVDRRLSGKGAYLVQGHEALVLGRVSMNISSCDVTHIPSAAVGDTVVIMSAEKNDANSTERIAQAIGTIPYEVLVRVPAHLERVFED